MKKYILSVDWDYFIDASALDRNMLFPDGGNENLSSLVQDIIWANRYAYKDHNEDGKKISEIGIKSLECELLIKLLQEQDSNIPICFAESHSDIYHFLTKVSNERDRFDITNIDYHHDFYNTGSNLNCGNWLRILNKYNKLSKITWVCQEDSDMDAIDKTKDLLNLSKTFSISEIGVRKYDCVFICRSGMWSPPHLDKHFNYLIESIKEKQSNIFSRTLFREDRMIDIDGLIKQLKNVVNNINEV